jgi:hypothetical protein
MQLDLRLELPDKENKEKKKVDLMCKHCDHNCHCSNGGQCPSCACMNCEHNALDDFYNRLNNGEKEIKK